MRFLSALICIACLLLPPLSSAAELQLHSVNPAIASSGATVQIFGTGFTPATRVLLGGQELTPELRDRKSVV